ncbi:MAG: hypothetical protein IJJ15_00600 [Ruminococcus sp.]|nr:hypothetical protein [Ruminococcus sp.]
MLDIHSHILPKMDDGAKDNEESIKLLRMSKEQGVTTMISTSHFYADRESPESFLRRRAHAFRKIEPLLGDDTPSLMFGAEVLYFYGISRSKEVRDLAIEGTNLILVELPFHPWPENLLDDLLSFKYSSGLSIILAHIERYQDIQTKKAFREMINCDEFYIQCNAEAFQFRASKKLAFKLYKEDKLDFIGSDCHSTEHRPPKIAEAKKIFIKKFGEQAWKDFCRRSEQILEEHKI